ncbi:universal stress protein [Thermodesulfobacteriota bacterium]
MAAEIKKILFPTDLTQHAQYAFKFAVSLADRYGATIAILHVMEDLPVNVEAQLAGFLGDEKWTNQKKEHEKDARETLIGKKRDGMMIRHALHSFCQDMKDGDPECNFTTDEIVVKSGNVVQEIIEQAETSNADLIVMAYYSRNMLAEAMMGGVTRRVLRRSKRPVLLVPMPESL